jgi:hypothetical protein
MESLRCRGAFEYCTIGQYRAGTGFDLKPDVTTTIRAMGACLVFALSLIFQASSAAVAQSDAQPDQVSAEHSILPSLESRDSICLMIESAARANDCPSITLRG